MQRSRPVNCFNLLFIQIIFKNIYQPREYVISIIILTDKEYWYQNLFVICRCVFNLINEDTLQPVNMDT